MGHRHNNDAHGRGTTHFEVLLSTAPLLPNDDESKWRFKTHLPPLPRPEFDQNAGHKIWMKQLTVKVEGFRLSYEKQSINRVLSIDPAEKFILLTLGSLKFPDVSPKETASYIERLLLAGIVLNGVKYLFYGHSNSQLKSKSCYLLATSSPAFAMDKINALGNFSNISSVAKRAKRIGLLFTAAEASVKLDPKFTKDIGDVEENGWTFTDGCGMINKDFAMQLAKSRRIIFHDVKYCPSAFQIRYKGYKGMLMLNPHLPKTEKAHLRASMKKFKDCKDDTFSVLNYSKPFTYAYLNGEVVTLLSALGISNETFLQKQNEYFDFLQDVGCGSSRELIFRFLCYRNEHALAEKVLLQGCTPQLLGTIKKHVKAEWSGMFKDKKMGTEKVERVRILIPQSRMLFGVCDYTGTLKEGECFVRITNEAANTQTLDGAEIIVTRNPCLHPGDIRKFKAVRNDNLNHLVDLVVFPVVGSRDPASLMSGGDLDGDSFFVCWDKDLIPQVLFEPYGYPPARETVQREINWKAMIHYFAQWNNASLGKVKNLYLKWAQAKNDAGCRECQELNKLFSSCVDGEGVKIPEHLETPDPNPDENTAWVLNVLVDNIKRRGSTIFQQDATTNIEVPPTEDQIIEILTSKELLCVRGEFELFQIILRFCSYTEKDIDDYIAYFDFGSFTSPQKHSVLNALLNCCGLRVQYAGPIFNALYQSNLLTPIQLTQANMQEAMVRWQIYYASEQDDGHRLYSSLENALAHFDKKLVVAKVDEFLTVAMYIPVRVEIGQEVNVGGEPYSRNGRRHSYFPTVKLFAWDPTSGHFYKKTTVRGYKLNFDGEIIQLFEKQIRNTFIWFALNQRYRVRNGMLHNGNGNSRKASQNEEDGHYKFSIALQKFDQKLLNSHKRVTKQVNSNLEIYVISNRDRVGHELLDIYMNQVDTKEVRKILDNIPREYELPFGNGLREEELDWSFREWCREIITSGGRTGLTTLHDFCEIEQVIRICLEVNSLEGRLIQIFHQIFENENQQQKLILLSESNLTLVQDTLKTIPSLAFSIINTLSSNPPPESKLVIIILKSLLRLANKEPETCKQNFSKLMDLVALKGIKFAIPVLVDFVKLILFSVRITQLAEDFLTTVFDPKQELTFAAQANTNTEDNLEQAELNYALHHIQALAMNYLGELNDACKCDLWGVPLGAEDFGNDDKSSSQDQSAKRFLMSDFFPGDTGRGNTKSDRNSTLLLIPTQINVEIKRSEQSAGAYTTILRTDIKCDIRNEDHVRFCASKKASNAKGRIPVFDAIVKSISMGKMEFVIVQEDELPELFLATWNIYVAASTTNFTSQLTAIMTLLEKKVGSTVAFYDILNAAPPSGHHLQDKIWREKLVPKKMVEFGNDTSFNASQKEAVINAVAGPVTTVWGPPGTGKTSVVVEMILQLLETYAGLRILVTASTHAAVDNIMERFIERRKGANDSSDTIRLSSDLSKVTPKLKRWTLDAFVGKDLHSGDHKAKGEAMKKWKESRIVFSTCSGSGVGLLRKRSCLQTALSIKGLFEEDEDGPPAPSSSKAKTRRSLEALQKFDVVIVDEASQITEPNALIPIVKSSNIVILVGDHVQLSPTVSEQGKLFQLEKSLFEKLYTSKTSTNCVKVMLDTQYRMHPLLASYPSSAFYDGKLKSGVSEESRRMQSSAFPWPQIGDQAKKDQVSLFPSVFVHCSSPETYNSGGGSSKMNKGQVNATLDIIKLLRKDLVQDENKNIMKPLGIVVLTPYSKQKKETELALKSLGAVGAGVEAHTIDGFQGREADIIIFATVRCNRHMDLGFMEDRKRINVALTRAKFGLIIVGDEETLRSNPETAKMISEPFCKKVDVPQALKIHFNSKQKK